MRETEKDNNGESMYEEWEKGNEAIGNGEWNIRDVRNGNEGEGRTEIGKWGKGRETEEERITKKRKKKRAEEGNAKGCWT